MVNVPLIRTMQIAAMIFAFGFIASGQTPAAEQGTPVIQLVAGDSNSRFVPLGVGKSIVIDLPRDIKDVLVADPTIANAVVRTARRAGARSHGGSPLTAIFSGRTPPAMPEGSARSGPPDTGCARGTHRGEARRTRL